MIANSLMSFVMLYLQEPAGSGKSNITTAVYIALAVVVMIAAGWLLLRKRK